MRTLLTKLNSTKAERRFAERLKALHISFGHRININGREVDFIIKQYAIDIDGHEQDGDKNVMLVKSGYTPLHIDNKSVRIISLNFLK